MYVCICLLYMRVCTCVCVYLHTHTYIFTHICIYATSGKHVNTTMTITCKTESMTWISELT